MDLNLFIDNKKLYQASKQLFKDLGFNINGKTDTYTLEELLGVIAQVPEYKIDTKHTELLKELQTAYFVGVLDQESLNQEVWYSLEDTQKAKYQDGLAVIAIEWTKKEEPKKADLVALVRMANRNFEKNPVVVLVRYKKQHTTYLSIGLPYRRLRKKRTHYEGEVIEKVSLIKDIDTHNPHRGHLEILKDLSAEKERTKITNFEELYDKWLEVLNLKTLNKKFYKEIANWFFWASKNVQFPQIRPKNEYKEDQAYQQESVIRLLTRFLFCWFLKEKGFIKNEVFDPKYMQNILKHFSPEVSKTGLFAKKTQDNASYYKAILQNLFFATLSKKMKEREYISDKKGQKGYSPEYGNAYAYRYKELFNDEKQIKILFENVPFLNGGLFESLDKVPKNDNDLTEEIRLDGFSSTQKKQAKVPDFLFFGQTSIDLSEEYDSKKQNAVPVKGLIHILNEYKFTIEENTPLEQEVALDPELLGEIFENLLAFYNPETAQTARKSTGSFYTPREIVEYMVEESLLAYLNPPKSQYASLKELIAKMPHKEIIDKLDNIKILDPACGSGAFPMGVLQKMLELLRQIDPKNERWFESLVKSFPVPMQADIKQKYKNENLDYLRKLGIIHKSIYGIDIQPIALQITKLRCFLSLVIEQKPDPSKENLGIKPLPNLEFKFVAANTLIDVPNTFPKDTEPLEMQDLREEFAEKTSNYFSIERHEEKEESKKKIIEVIQKITDQQQNYINQFLKDAYKKRNTASPTEKKRIQDRISELENAQQQWLSFKNIFEEKTVAFFNTTYFFPEVKEGFDVVIGNPPYVQLQKMKEQQKALEAQNFESYTRTGDLYALFYEKGNQLLKPNGLLSFITSNKWMRAGYGEKLRKYFVEKTQPLALIDLGAGVFESATVDTNILLFRRGTSSRPVRFSKPDRSEGTPSPEGRAGVGLKALTYQKSELSIAEAFQKNHITLTNLSAEAWTISKPIEQQIKAKIEKIGTPLKEWDIQIYRGVLTGYNEAFIIDEQTKNELIKQDPKSAEIIKPILRGRDIKRYKAEFAGLYLINSHNGLKSQNIPRIDVSKNYPAIYKHLLQFEKQLQKRQDKGEHWTNLRNCAYLQEFEKEKIIFQEMVQESSFAYDKSDNFFCNDTGRIITGSSLKFLVSVLNSKLFFFSIKYFYGGGGLGESGVRMKHTFFEKFPLPQIPLSAQKSFEDLVDKILAKKERGEDTAAEEREIDRMVYTLYGLTEEEIKVVEG